MKVNKIALVVTLIVLLCLPINVFAIVDITQDSPQHFTDIEKYKWAKDAINYFGRAGIIKGDGKGNYLPGNKITREEFATMLANSFNADSSVSTQTFSDVPVTKWSYKYIESTKEYLTGYYPPAGKPFFDPAGYATREDVGVALAKMIGLSEDDLVNPNILKESFIDAEQVSFNLRGLMSIVVEQEIMLGGNKKLRPTAPITRAEAAVLLYKVIKSSVSDANEPLKLDVEVPEKISIPDTTISGTTIPGAKVKVNGYDAKVNSSGQFEISVTFPKEGEYNVEIFAIKNGRKAIVNKTLKYEEIIAKIETTNCPATSSTPNVTIEGTISNTDSSSVFTINGETVYFSNTSYYSDIYNFSYNATLKEGANEFKFIVKNKRGKETVLTKTITYNIAAPEISITQCPETSTQNTVTISGNVKYGTDYIYPNVHINNESVYVDYLGAWSKSVTLSEGKNTYTIKATNSNGKSTEITKEIVYAVAGPKLTITQCPETSTQNTVTISGTVEYNTDLYTYPSVYINNDSVYVDYYGAWSKSVTLSNGKNTYTIKATNSKGKSTVITKEVVYTVAGPELTITQCPSTSTKNTVTISGTVNYGTDYAYPNVYINNESVYVDWNGAWSKSVTLSEGSNTYTIRATNSSGKSTEITKEVVYTAAGPELTITQCPETSSKNTVTISGTVNYGTDYAYPNVYINNESVYVNWNGAWSKSVTLSEGSNTYTIKATNSNGNSTEITKEVVYTVADVAAPVLTITQCPETSSFGIETISGTLSDSADFYPRIYINDEQINWFDGAWSKTVFLSKGINTFTIKATNSYGKSTVITKEIVYTVATP
ncbi:MAG: S-layer homology domain-containing protein [Ruminiclostridium sp.]